MFFGWLAGLLQWVDNTMSLAMYLVDGYKGFMGAHLRYKQEGHYTHEEAQMIMYRTQMKESLGEQWRVAYDEITSKFPPILRKFFLERYQSAAHWYVYTLLGTLKVSYTVICSNRGLWLCAGCNKSARTAAALRCRRLRVTSSVWETAILPIFYLILPPLR